MAPVYASGRHDGSTVIHVRFVTRLVVLLAATAIAMRLAEPATASAARADPPMVLGYYVPYDSTSWFSLQAHADGLDVVAAQWVTIDGCGNLGSRDDQTLKQFARDHNLKVLPSLLTLSGWLNHQILTDETAMANALDQIVSYTVAEDYDGFDLDLEGVDPADRDALTAFVASAGDALHANGKLLTLAIPPKERDVTVGWAGAYDYAALGAPADLVTIMAYEYRGPFSGPGSVAPFDWVQRVTRFATSQIPPDKVLLGLAFYGYDWNTTSGSARSLGYAQFAALAERYQAPVAFDPAQRSLTFEYEGAAGDPPPAIAAQARLNHAITVRTAPPCEVQPPPTPAPAPRRPAPPAGTPQAHAVWLEDSASAAARLDLAATFHTGGVATWRLGLEDPNVWDLFKSWLNRTAG
jgi:spore germination protein